jgi:MFS family permease
MSRLAVVELAVGQVALQAGFYGFIASMPIALSRSGTPDAEIGLIVGLAAAAQIIAALLGGPLLDRFGSMRLLVAGSAAFLISIGVLLLPDSKAGSTLAPFAVARLIQNIGFGLVRPAWLSLLPRVLPKRRAGIALGIAVTSQNASLSIIPPISLGILGASSSLDGVALFVAGLVIAGAASLLVCRGHIERESEIDSVSAASRRYGMAFRSAWAPPLLIILLYMIHWGVVTAYLPQRAELSGNDVGLFFLMDGAWSLGLRMPAAWLAERVSGRWLVIGGLAITGIGISLLLVPMSTAGLLLAGCLTGGGGSFVALPIYLELAHTSSKADRGSAFAALSAIFAAGLALGSIAAAPIVTVAGFSAAIFAAILGLMLAVLVSARDKNLAIPNGRQKATAMPGP